MSPPLKGIKAAVITVSTSKSAGDGVDESGPVAAEILRGLGADVVASELVPDDRQAITDLLIRHSDHLGVNLIATTGGTGVSPTDVTPEATFEAAERVVPGISEHIRAVSLQKTPHAMLSRGVSAIRGKTLIVNLPGSPGGVRDGLAAVSQVLGHACRLLEQSPTTHFQT